MSEGKAGLTAYIVLRADSIDEWEEGRYKQSLRHIPSGIIVGGIGKWHCWHTEIYENKGQYGETICREVGFTFMQKWKIHRKLKKLQQRMQKRANEAAAQKALEAMVAGVLGGKEGK